MKALIFILTVITLHSCVPDLEFDLLECENPRTSSISGVVIDNFTLKGIEGAKLNVRNLAIGENEYPRIVSDDRGIFSFSTTACSFATGNHHRYDGISHPDYPGAAASSNLENMKILMFKNIEVKLIFNNITPEIKELVKYKHWFCIYPDNVCHRTRGSGEFIPTDKNTITIQVAEGEDLFLDYKIDDGSYKSDTFNILDQQEIKIDY